MALVTYNPSFAEQQVNRKKGACETCKRESLGVRSCTRCGQVKYCNTTCQRQDFPRHKELCIMWSNFETAKNRIHADMKRVWLNQCGKMGFSFLLASLPDLTRYRMVGQRVCVIVQIVKVEYTVGQFLPLIVVRDVTNQCITMSFAPGAVDLIVAAFLLTPGRYLILLNVPLRVYSFTERISQIYINHGDQFKVIA